MDAITDIEDLTTAMWHSIRAQALAVAHVEMVHAFGEDFIYKTDDGVNMRHNMRQLIERSVGDLVDDVRSTVTDWQK